MRMRRVTLSRMNWVSLLAIGLLLVWGCAPTSPISPLRRINSPKAESESIVPTRPAPVSVRTPATVPTPPPPSTVATPTLVTPGPQPGPSSQPPVAHPPAEHATPPAVVAPSVPTPAPERPASPPPVRTAPKVNLAAERQKLLERDRAFSALSEQKGAAEAFYEFMTPDATLLQSGELPIKGSETIKVRMAAGQQGTLTWQPEEAEVSAHGDMAYTWGNYNFHGKTADSRSSSGKYVTVWKKQDGEWKVAVSSSNANPIPPARRTESGNQ